MPTGDFPPPEGMRWTDAFGYVPLVREPFGWADLNNLCTECGAPIRDHLIGGSRYHPKDRTPLWLWE